MTKMRGITAAVLDRAEGQMMQRSGILKVTTLVALLCCSGCTSVARLSDLPQSGDAIQYGQAGEKRSGQYEYDFTLHDVTDEQFENAVREGLTTNGFVIKRSDPGGRVIFAERGLRLNEWASVVGIYSRRSDANLQVKVLVDITQDITGTLPQSYAENIANRIRDVLSRDIARPVESL
jgi:hypothetical protein